MLPVTERLERRVLSRSLYRSLYCATDAVDRLATEMYRDHFHTRRSILGHDFSINRTPYSEFEERNTLVDVVRTWIGAHEETQVMLASVLVVIGLWWLVRTLLNLLINLICPLLVVLLAVVCVPQLRGPLLGENYPALANTLKSILLKMADNIKTP